MGGRDPLPFHPPFAFCLPGFLKQKKGLSFVDAAGGWRRSSVVPLSFESHKSNRTA